MFYKLQYNISDDPHPHQRYYNALSPEVAACMFEATCEDGSLTGENVTLISVEPLFTADGPDSTDLTPCEGFNEQIG